MPAIPDFAIIGSGVSGGRVALDLTAAGARCVLIEAGPALDAATFPRDEIDGSGQMFWGGGIELSKDGRLGLLRARCLGGTSVVNQALLDRFDDLALDDWRQRSGIDWLRAESMAPYYDRAESGLVIREIPEQHRNRNARLFADGFAKLGLHCEPLRRGEADCRHDQGSDCIACLIGCPRDSKQSSLVTSIRRAAAQGLTIEAGFEVQRLVTVPGEVRILGVRGGQPEVLCAARAVLAAGALGNAGILLRSDLRATLPALGTRFSCHPQLMTFARFDEPVDAHKGALQAFKSADPKLRSAGYKFENVFTPPIATAMLVPGRGRAHHRIMRSYRHLAAMEVAVRDDATGKIRPGHNNALVVDKRLTSADRRKARAGLDLIRELFTSLGAREIVECRQAFGLHLMGGCPIGTDPRDSVVGPDFRIHGHDNLFAADSSVFPSAPGINPSLTIIALAVKAAEEMAR